MNSADEFYESIEKDYDEGKHKRDNSGKFSRAMDAHMETAEALHEDPEYQSRQKKQAIGAVASVGGAAGALLSRHPGTQVGLGAASLGASGYSLTQGVKGNKRARKVAKPIFEKHGVGNLVKRDIETVEKFYDEVEKDWTEYDKERGKNRLTPDAKKGLLIGGAAGLVTGPGAPISAAIGGAVGSHIDSIKRHPEQHVNQKKRDKAKARGEKVPAMKRDIESPFIRKAWDADPKAVSKAEPGGYKLFTGFDEKSGKPKGQQLLEHMQHNGRARDAEVAADEAKHANTDAGIARRALRVRKAESPFIAKAVGTQNRMAGMQQTESAMQQNAMQQATEMLAPQVAQQVMQMQQEAEQQFWQEQQQLAMLGQQMNAGSPQSNLNTGPGTQGTYEMGPQLRGPRMSSPPSLRSLSAGPKGPAIGPQ